MKSTKSFFNFFKKRSEKEKKEEKSKKDLFDEAKKIQELRFSVFDLFSEKKEKSTEEIIKNSVNELKKADDFIVREAQAGAAMDDCGDTNLAGNYGIYTSSMPPQLLEWFNRQSFIGWYACAQIHAGSRFVRNACTIPAEDAFRHGYELQSADGSVLSSDIIDKIRKLDLKFRVNHNLREFVTFLNVFGVRVAKFEIESSDKDFYKKPFNPDGIGPNSYKGISQIDPNWIMPVLSINNAVDPSSIHFYEPEFWNVKGELIHRSHLIIGRLDPPADILKPSYLFGGIPLTQAIYERLYAADRTANEAPLLAMTKRLLTMTVDTERAMMNQSMFEKKIGWLANCRDNLGVLAIGEQEQINQIETNITGLDDLIASQYQLVASIARMPVTKLMCTSPKGFNATGEYEAKDYHTFLESIQESYGTELVNRHHLCLIRSHIAPDEPFDVSVVWNPVNPKTEEEIAEINYKKALTKKILIEIGAITPNEARQSIISDESSGFTGIEQDNDELKLYQQNILSGNGGLYDDDEEPEYIPKP